MYHRLGFSSGTLLLAMVLAGTAHGKVSEEEAAKLGKELTPFGGETAGNADGTIPKWEPKWLGPVPGIEYGGPGTLRPDPYADEKPLFSITPANYKEYKDRLTEGQIALFERYETFRMDIYPTRRDFDYNPRMVEKVKWNATNTELANGVESLQHWTGSTAFPIPQGPEEVMWNMRSNHCYEAFHTISMGCLPTASAPTMRSTTIQRAPSTTRSIRYRQRKRWPAIGSYGPCRRAWRPRGPRAR
jgi:hypothetical protein